MTIANIESLSFCYEGRDRPAIEDINMVIEENELVLLMGPSGCGKTTLCLCLNGVIPNAIPGKLSGQITIGGHAVRDSSVAELCRLVGILFQDPEAQLVNLYVEDEVAFGCENLCVDPTEIQRRVDNYLDMLDISPLAKSLCHKLSGGEKQKVALASVLAMKPRLLVLDEPTSSLDPTSAMEIIEILDKLRKDEDLAILLIEHKSDPLLHRVDKVVVMSEGKVVAQGSPRAVLREEGHSILAELGLWIPQVSEVAVRQNYEKGVDIPVPLTVDEAFEAFLPRLSLRPHLIGGSPNPGPQKTGGQQPLFEVKDLSFDYHEKAGAVRDATLTIHDGEFLAIVGKNGSGKTTLSKLMVGLLQASRGEVLVRGRPAHKIPKKEIARTVGYIFQNPEDQFLTDTVYDEVAYSLRALDVPAAEVDTQVQSLLASFGLDTLKDSHPFNLSMGQKRRLSVCTMVPYRPSCLILDEPTMGQDLKGTYALLNLLKEFHSLEATVVVITHEMRILAEWPERAIAMADGRILFDGPVADLFLQPRILEQASLLEPAISRLSRKVTEALCLESQPCLTVDGFLNMFDLN